jgi:hypothetical protein
MASDWRYHQLGFLPAVGWQGPGFDDSGWPVGGGVFHFGSAPPGAPDGTVLGAGRITYYFRTTFHHPGPPGGELALTHFLDDGMVAYLNGAEFYRLRLPAGPVGNSTLASPAVRDPAQEGPFAVPAPGLVNGENVLAVEVHQAAANSDDLAFGVKVEPGAAAAAPATPGAPNSASGALPGLPAVRVNEWLASNPGPYADPADGRFDDWFELYNTGDAPVDLSGFTLTDDLSDPDRFTIPQGTVSPAGGFLLVWADGETYQNAPGADLHASFRLSADGETVALVSPDGRAVDAVTFGPQSPGVSEGRQPDGGETTLAFDSPSPGASNTTAPPALPTRHIQPLPDGPGAHTITTLPGHTYQAESSAGLQPETWTPAGPPVAGDGTEATVVARPPDGAQRWFLRVRVGGG